MSSSLTPNTSCHSGSQSTAYKADQMGSGHRNTTTRWRWRWWWLDLERPPERELDISESSVLHRPFFCCYGHQNAQRKINSRCYFFKFPSLLPFFPFLLLFPLHTVFISLHFHFVSFHFLSFLFYLFRYSLSVSILSLSIILISFPFYPLYPLSLSLFNIT